MKNTTAPEATMPNLTQLSTSKLFALLEGAQGRHDHETCDAINAELDKRGA
jgi:hypothetical protein